MRAVSLRGSCSQCSEPRTRQLQPLRSFYNEAAMRQLGAPGRKQEPKQLAYQPSRIILSLLSLAVLWFYAWTTLGAGSQPRRESSSIQHRKAAAAAFLPEVQAPCPTWIAEYAAFHRQNRGKPGTKYLVYSACPGYSGLGDRIRGMMYLTRLAAATNRVVLFTWRNEPHEIEQYLPPAADIDWTLRGIEGYDYPDMSMFCGKNASNTDARSFLPGFEQYESSAVPATAKGSSSSSKRIKHRKQQQDTGSIALRVTDYKSDDSALRRWIVDGGLKHLEQHQFITIHTNEQLNVPCPDCTKVAGPAPQPVQNQDGSRTVDRSAACLYRHLFGLSDEVQMLAQKQLESLYGRQARRPGFQYLAVHLRLGGMENEAKLSKSKGSGSGPLTDLAHSITCIKNLGQEVGINASKVPVLLFTDHHELRKFIKQGGLANVITTDALPTHLARMDDAEVADPKSAISTYVDLAMMARARCAVYSTSGYSMAAWMMGGGTDCCEQFQWGLARCLSEAAGSAGLPSVGK